MIIHSYEYYVALKNELEGLQRMVLRQPYADDIVFATNGIKNEILVCEYALKSHDCLHCFHRKGSCEPKPDGSFLPTEGSLCSVNGTFPLNLDLSKHVCPNWVFEDIPF